MGSGSGALWQSAHEQTPHRRGIISFSALSFIDNNSAVCVVLVSVFRGLLRGVLLARPKVTTQGCRRVARSAAGLVRANPPTGHHLPSRPSPSAICDLPPAGCCSASHQLAHLRIPWSNSWWQGMPRQHNQMQPQRQPPAGPSAHSPVQFLAPRPAGPHNQRQPRRPPACSPDRTN